MYKPQKELGYTKNGYSMFYHNGHYVLPYLYIYIYIYIGVDPKIGGPGGQNPEAFKFGLFQS